MVVMLHLEAKPAENCITYSSNKIVNVCGKEVLWCTQFLISHN